MNDVKLMINQCRIVASVFKIIIFRVILFVFVIVLFILFFFEWQFVTEFFNLIISNRPEQYLLWD